MGIPLRVLIVEDSEDDAALVLRELERGGYEPRFRRVDTAAGMAEALQAEAWDIVLSDYAMPSFNGLEALRLLQARGIDLPFIVVSGTIGEETAVEAMKAGVHDYVIKGNLSRLVPAIDRELRDAAGRRERRRMEERLQQAALYDALTGLPNRALFLDRLGWALSRCQRHPACRFGVLFVDLDRFRGVVESFGHLVGDQLLTAVARRLELCVRPGDTVAHLGGDTYALLLDDLRDEAEPGRAAERIREHLAPPVIVGGQEMFLSACVGIALSEPGYERPEDLLRDANTAMHRAKALGKGRQQVFDKAMHVSAVSRLSLEADLGHAIDRGELEVRYQAIVGLETRAVESFEALLRWNHPRRGIVDPSEFISLSEENGLILAIGEWVLREACAQAAAWARQRPGRPPVAVAVNLSGRQFMQPDLGANIERLLEQNGLDPALLHLEITETVLMSDAPVAVALLQRLKALGIRLHIDDFGTGYSSLSYLHRLPADALKIDRSFVLRMEGHREDTEIARTIVMLAHAMRMEVIAEGVETEAQAGRLREFGCEHGQGFLFARPMSAAEATQLIVGGKVEGSG